MFYRPEWPTRDNAVPFKLFYLLISTFEAIEAREKLERVQAAALGQAVAENGDSQKVKKAVRKVDKRAYPWK